MLNISLPTEELLASQEGLCCIKTVCYCYCYSLLEHTVLQKQALVLLQWVSCYTHKRTHTHTNKHTRKTHTNIRTHKHTQTHTYTNTHTNTHKHTYKRARTHAHTLTITIRNTYCFSTATMVAGTLLIVMLYYIARLITCKLLYQPVYLFVTKLSVNNTLLNFC